MRALQLGHGSGPRQRSWSGQHWKNQSRACGTLDSRLIALESFLMMVRGIARGRAAPSFFRHNLSCERKFHLSWHVPSSLLLL